MASGIYGIEVWYGILPQTPTASAVSRSGHIYRLPIRVTEQVNNNKHNS